MPINRTRIKTVRIPGIYKIVNKINHKFYIGSTCSLNHRKISHFCELRKNNHANSYLQNAFNKYKENNFEFILIETFKFPDNYDRKCLNEYLESREQYYIDTLNPQYNIQREVNGMPVVNITDKHSSIVNAKAILKCDYDGNIIEKCDSITKSKRIGWKEHTVRRSINGNYTLNDAYIYIYEKEYNSNNFISHKNKILDNKESFINKRNSDFLLSSKNLEKYKLNNPNWYKIRFGKHIAKLDRNNIIVKQWNNIVFREIELEEHIPFGTISNCVRRNVYYKNEYTYKYI